MDDARRVSFRPPPQGTAKQEIVERSLIVLRFDHLNALFLD
jgi:hypothetical protein